MSGEAAIVYPLVEGDQEIDIRGYGLRSIPDILLSLCRVARDGDLIHLQKHEQQVLHLLEGEVPINFLDRLEMASNSLKRAESSDWDEHMTSFLAVMEQLGEEIASHPASDSFANLRSQVENIIELGIDSAIEGRQGHLVSKTRRVLRETQKQLRRLFMERAAEIAKRLKRITTLDLGANSIRILPEELATLSALTSLGCDHNRFMRLPEVIRELNRLKVLDFESNSLEVVPDWIGELQALREIAMSWNELTTLPETLGLLSRLENLSIAANRLASLPTSLRNLTRMRRLTLRENNFIAFPEELLSCRALTVLDLSDNEISSLPSAWGSLTSLQHLDVSDNKLTEVPTSIGELRVLKFLALGGNELRSLPRSLTSLPRTVDIKLDGNPLPPTLLQAARRGTAALFAYLDSLEGESSPCREAKLLLVGEGNVGKTSLVSSLRGDGFVEDRDTTHGIELKTIELPGEDPETVFSFNTWDFGGQEIYRITHPFFFSQEAIYLVVWRPRDGFEQGGVEYWLKRIWHRVGTRARVILVSTYADEGRQSLIDYQRLTHEYHPLIVGRCEVDNRTGRGIEELKGLIAKQAGTLKHIEDLIADSWTKVRKSMRRIRRPFIDIGRYQELARKEGLDSSAVTTWLGLLHDLGDVIHFDSDMSLNSTIVLDAETLTRAVSYVLEDPTVIEAGGFVKHQHLKTIWGSPESGLAASLHPYILRLMEKYEISYRVDNRDASLVAPVVPHSRPSLPWEPTQPLPKGMNQMSLVCRMKGEAPGLIAWLTVRNHRWSTGRHWRRGVFLHNPRQQVDALIEEDGHSVRMWVRGGYPNEMFSVLRAEIDWLLTDRWSNLEFEFLIPCSQFLAGPGACKGEFRFASLLKASEKGHEVLQCPECFEPKQLSRLMTGFENMRVDPSEILGRVETQVRELAVEFGQERHERVAVTRELSLNVATMSRVQTMLREMSSSIGLLVRDCPHLFTLHPLSDNSKNPSRLWKRRFRLRLWCEHPNEEHPTGSPYEFTRPQEWLARASPLVSVMQKAVTFLPLFSSCAESLLPTKDWEEIKAEIDLMKELAKQLAALPVDESGVQSLAQNPSRVEDYELRVLKELLMDIDPPPQKFAGLRQVGGQAGNILWVCEKHYPYYDRGLPKFA